MRSGKATRAYLWSTVRNAAAVSVLAGCISACVSVPGMSPKGPPAWVIQPPADNAGELFGIGEGHDLATAKRLALRDIAAKFKVSVSGTVENRTTVRNKQVDSAASQRVSDRVEDIEFKNPTLVQSAANGAGGFYALMRVDRQEFLREQRSKFAALATQVQAGTADLDRQSQIEQLMTLKRHEKNMVKAPTYLQWVDARELSAEETAQVTKLQALKQRADQAATQLVLGVRTTRDNQDVADVVSRFLADQGVRTRADNGPVAAVVDTQVKPRLDDVQGNRLVRLDVALTVRDPQQRVVASQAYVVSGASISSHDAARQQAVGKLADELRKAGLLPALGFKLD